MCTKNTVGKALRIIILPVAPVDAFSDREQCQPRRLGVLNIFLRDEKQQVFFNIIVQVVGHFKFIPVNVSVFINRWD